ncbi:MAG: hypothetical protein KAI70_07875 [Candidatus Omnitrophica bacterium]|nr:hypothetical protein [Candidatus Omnitrophota bacterium]
MRYKKLLISSGLAAFMIAAGLVCPLSWADNTDGEPAEQAMHYNRILVGYYRNFLTTWDAKEQDVLCALIQTPAQYDTLFHPAATMPVRSPDKPRPFSPDGELYKTEQILIVARVMVAPKDDQLDSAFEVDKITAKDGELVFYYCFNEPKEVWTFFVTNYLAVRIPKYNYKRVTFFENGKQIGELKLSEGQWSIPAMTTEVSELAGHADAGKQEETTSAALLAQATDSASEIKDLKQKFAAFEEIAKRYEEIGLNEKARAVKLKESGARYSLHYKEKFLYPDKEALARAYIAVKYTQAGEENMASLLLAEAEGTARRIEDSARRIDTLVKLSGSYAEAGLKQKAKEMLSEMPGEVDRMMYDYSKDPDFMRWGPGVERFIPFFGRFVAQGYVRNCIRSEIVVNLVRAGEEEKGLAFAKKIGDSLLRAGTIREIALFYFEEKRYDDMFDVLMQIRK